MCELFPILHSCCGIPVRLALLFIAILSIVTGAMINAGLKKAGVNISNIDAVKGINKDSFKMYKEPEITSPKNFVLPKNKTIIRNVIIVTPKRTKRTTTTTKKITRAGEESTQETVELLGDDVLTTVHNPSEDDGMNTMPMPFDNYGSNDQDGGDGSDNQPDPDVGPQWPTTSSVATVTTTITTTTTTPSTTTTSELIRRVGSVNRNGINLLACGFIALGILLLVANFTNSTELGLIYVVLNLVNTAAAFFLLVGTVSECTKAQQSCLLSRMDWFSGFVLTLFWFIYIFVWIFFTGVANAFANGIHM